MTKNLQRGVISITSWAILGLGAALALSLGANKLLYDAKVSEHDARVAFEAKVTALGEQAERDATMINKLNKLRKERVDAKVKTAVAASAAAAGRVRDDIASGGVVPRAAPAAADPARACYGRAELDAALRRFAAGAADLVGEGGRAVDVLDELKRDAQTR